MTDEKMSISELLSELESSHQMIESLSVFGTTSWVSIKNLVFEKSLSDISFATVARKSFLSPKTIFLLGLSIWNYMRRITRLQRQDIFVGAGSGVFFHDNKYLDSYLPSELSSELGIPKESTLYWINANHLSKMWEQRSYLIRQQAIIFSLILSPLRLFFGILFSIFLLQNRKIRNATTDLSFHLSTIGVNISSKELIRMHARFCAGYVVYRVLLYPFSFEKAYVVSAYSNSEVCAVLKQMGVQVIEVQHGLIGSTHRGYNYSIKNPLLPTPHQVSVYSDFWKQELQAAGYFSSEQIVINQRLKYKLAQYENIAFDFQYIVFTGQGLLQEKIIDFISEFDSIKSKLHLVYVPHPNEDAEYISRIMTATKSDRVHFVLNMSTTTERLIMGCQAHLSIYSSCHFDSIHYKDRTFIYDIIEENPIYDYSKRHSSKFIYIKNAQELLGELKVHA